MIDPHTPTIEQIRETYAEAIEEMGGRFLGFEFFDRSLSKHDSEVAKHAWDEGWTACADWWGIHHHKVVRNEQNPYGAGQN